MFAELSSKKLAAAFTIAVLLAGAVFFTYTRENDYLKGFSSRYYAAAIGNAFAAALYRIQLSADTGFDSLASFFSVLSSPKRPPASSGDQGYAVPILLYHGIVEKPNGSGFDVTEEEFKEQMFALARAGYRTISIADLQQFLEGAKTLPPKSFVLTFDDGRKDSFYNADSVLQATGYRAVIAIITAKSLGEESLHSTYYLSEWELKQILGTGRWEIISHAKNGHSLIQTAENGERGSFYGNKLWREEEGRLESDEEFSERVKNDLKVSKRDLEEYLHIPIAAFAFPFGEFGEESGNFPDAKSVLLDLAASVYPISFYQFKTDNRFTANYPHPQGRHPDVRSFAKRIEAKSDWTASTLLAAFARAEAKPLPFDDDFSSDTGWIMTWGSITRTPSGLLVRAPDGVTGSAMILDGSRLWENYTMRVTLLWNAGRNVYLWARFEDDENFAACNFGKTRAHVEQKYNGALRVIRGVDRTIPDSESGREIELGIRVAGRTVECLVDGEVFVASNFLEPGLDSGGVGVKIWDPVPETSSILIHGVSVRPE